MDKLCKRCQFRTPQTRSFCQVCGHTKFVALETASAAVASKAAPILAEASPIMKPSPAALVCPSSNALESVCDSVSNWYQGLTSSICAGSLDMLAKIKSAASKAFLLAVTPAADNEPAAIARTLSHSRVRNSKANSSRAVDATGCAGVTEVPDFDKLAQRASDTAATVDACDKPEDLNDLLVWFQTYGRNEQLLRPGLASLEPPPVSSADSSDVAHAA